MGSCAFCIARFLIFSSSIAPSLQIQLRTKIYHDAENCKDDYLPARRVWLSATSRWLLLWLSQTCKGVYDGAFAASRLDSHLWQSCCWLFFDFAFFMSACCKSSLAFSVIDWSCSVFLLLHFLFFKHFLLGCLTRFCHYLQALCQVFNFFADVWLCRRCRLLL